MTKQEINQLASNDLIDLTNEGINKTNGGGIHFGLTFRGSVIFSWLKGEYA